MKKLATFISLSIVVGGFIALNFSSCVNNDPTIANIRVIDTIGTPVEGVDVKVYCTETPCVVEDSGRTDGQGKTSHEFELPAVLKVDAWKVYCWEYDMILLWDTINAQFDTFTDTTVCRTFYGETFVTLEEHEIVDQDVLLVGTKPTF